MVKKFTLLLLIGSLVHFSGVQAQEKGPLVPTRDGTVKFIKFYPNPATTTINFEFQHGYDRSYSFEIYNFLGKKVYEIKNVSATNQVALDNFNRGVYIFQLRDKFGKILESGKFQVSK